jgi:hypothetical protein
MNDAFRRAWHWLGVVLITLSTAAGAQTASSSVAIVMDRQGDIEVTSSGQRARVNLLDYLPAESQIKLARGSTSTIVYLSTSQEWILVGPGRYRLGASLPVVLDGAAPTARAVPKSSSGVLQRMETSQRERMTLGALVMRSAVPLPRLRSPDNMDVLQPRVTLLWHNPRQQMVRVVVQSATNSAEVARVDVADEKWTVQQALPPGDYEWHVALLNDSPKRTQLGRFRVVDPSDDRHARYRDRATTFSERLARAMQLEADNLPHDAQLIWQELSIERPQEETLKAWLR